jgi:hypothetical protein
MCIAVQKTERSLPVDGQVSRRAISEISSQRWYTLTLIDNSSYPVALHGASSFTNPNHPVIFTCSSHHGGTEAHW